LRATGSARAAPEQQIGPSSRKCSVSAEGSPPSCDGTTRSATAWRLDDTSGTAILMATRAFGLPSNAFHGVMGPRLMRRSMAVREFLGSNWHVVTIAVTAATRSAQLGRERWEPILLVGPTGTRSL